MVVLSKIAAFTALILFLFTEHLTVDNSTAELWLVQPLDRENAGLQNPLPLTVTCLVTAAAAPAARSPRRCETAVRIRILDQNDNAPYLEQQGRRVQTLTGFNFEPSQMVRLSRLTFFECASRLPPPNLHRRTVLSV